MNETKFETNGSVLKVARTFNAPNALVWRAWTEAELLDQWWAPAPWKSQTKSMNFAPNGKRLYAMVGPEGEEHWGLTNYKSIEPFKSFTGEDVFCDSAGNTNEEMPVAEFQNEFKDETHQTTVVMVTKYASEAHLKQVIEMGMKEGLSMAFEGLDQVVGALK